MKIYEGTILTVDTEDSVARFLAEENEEIKVEEVCLGGKKVK